MQYIPLSQKKHPHENTMSGSKAVPEKLPRLLTNPEKILTKFATLETSSSEIMIRRKPTNKEPVKNAIKQPIRRAKGPLISATTGKPLSLKETKARANLEELVERNGRGDATVKELLNLDTRLKRLKSKLKEKFVKTRLGDSVGLFEDIFQHAFEPLPKENKPTVKTGNKAAVASKAPKYIPKTTSPEKVIISSCVTCGQPYKPAESKPATKAKGKTVPKKRVAQKSKAKKNLKVL